ncbi:MAG: DNA repair protein RecO [bacterium]|nr:DNA repair protein RecO [bacterium]
MASHAKSRGIIIRTIDYSNTSVIVHLLTPEETIVHAIARGAKKSKSIFSGKLELFSCVECNYIVSTRSNMHVLVDCSVIRRFHGLCADIDLLYLASFMSEIVSAISWDIKSGAKVYVLFESVMDCFDCPVPFISISLLTLFLLHILEIQGILPNEEQCVGTGKIVDGIAQFEFSPSVSPVEQRKNVISRECIRQVYSALSMAWKDAVDCMVKMPQKELIRLNAVLLCFLREEIGKQIRTEKFLKSAGLIES